MELDTLSTSHHFVTFVMPSKILVETELFIPICFGYSYIYAATLLHVHNDLFLLKIFNNCNYS